MGNYYESQRLGPIMLMTEWRVISEFPEFEINKDGRVRNIKTKKFRNTQDGRNSRLQVMRDGVRTGVTIRKLRNRAFPELPSW